MEAIEEFLDANTSIEWLILADSAEVVGGKLYLMGGGWDRLTVHSQPAKKNLAVALALRVPMARDQQAARLPDRHDRRGRVPDRQRQRRLTEVGRPAGIPPGQPQLVQLVVNFDATLEEAWDLRHHRAGKRLTGTLVAIQHRARPGRLTAERLAALPLASHEGPRDTSVRPPARCSKKTA